MLSETSRSQGEHVPRPLHSDVLQRLMAENRRFGPVLRGGSICNHYSMALLAAWGLGAGDRELAKFHHFLDGRYRVSWEELPAARTQLNSKNWTAGGFNDLGSLAQFRELFLAESRALGRDEMLRLYLPRLVLGQHKGLFHPMIRLSFALLSPGASAEESAEALAYSSSRHEPLYPSALQDFGAALDPGMVTPSGGPEANIGEIEEQVHIAWGELRRMYAERGYDGSGHSFQVLAELYRDKRLHSVCLSHLPVSESTAEEVLHLLVHLALQLYQIQPGLTTLHAVTGGHAVCDLQAHLHPAAKVVSAKLYWVWLSTLFVEKGSPAVSRWSQSNDVGELTWPAIRSLALAPLEHDGKAQGGLGDQEPQTHCIKMVYSCDVMYRKSGHPLYLVVANSVASSGRPW